MRKNKLIIKKFNIQDHLNSVPYFQRQETKLELLKLLNISESTFNRILYANLSDKQDISATNLFKLAKYFDIKAEDLINEPDTIRVGSVVLTQ